MIPNEEIIELLSWLEYEFSLTTEYDRDKPKFEALNTGRIAMEKYGNMLKKLGFKSLKDWHKRGEVNGTKIRV